MAKRFDGLGFAECLSTDAKQLPDESWKNPHHRGMAVENRSHISAGLARLPKWRTSD
jgi:hypothetical protein